MGKPCLGQRHHYTYTTQLSLPPIWCVRDCFLRRNRKSTVPPYSEVKVASGRRSPIDLKVKPQNYIVVNKRDKSRPAGVGASVTWNTRNASVVKPQYLSFVGPTYAVSVPWWSHYGNNSQAQSQCLITVLSDTKVPFIRVIQQVTNVKWYLQQHFLTCFGIQFGCNCYTRLSSFTF